MGVTAEMTTLSSSNHRNIQVAPDKSFTKSVIHPGSGLVRPNEGSTCVVQISQSGEPESISEVLIGYPLGIEATICLGDGEGLMSDIIDTCLEMMLPGETCIIEVAVETLRGIIQKMQKLSDNDVQNQPFESVKLQIELKSFEREKDIHEMTVEDIMDKALKKKTKGSNCFSRGKLEMAERAYLRAVKYLLTVDPLEMEDISDGTRDNFNSLKSVCLVNLAACKLKYKRYEHVISNCTKALAIDGHNIKGLFRRGIAYMELQEYEKAGADLELALHLEPNSKPIKQQRQILKERMKSLDAKYAKAMSKMFGGQ